MPRPGSIDVVKERHWRGIIRDWQESGLSMAGYCQREKIKINQLSAWFKKIRARDHARNLQAADKSSARTVPKRPSGKPESPASSETGATGFAEVRVKDDMPSAENAQDTILDVALTCGIVLRLRDKCSMSFLVKVVNSLEDRDV
jgi:hypothetical protein